MPENGRAGIKDRAVFKVIRTVLGATGLSKAVSTIIKVFGISAGKKQVGAQCVALVIGFISVGVYVPKVGIKHRRYNKQRQSDAFGAVALSVMRKVECMIDLTYTLFDDPTERKLSLSFEEYYESLEGNETYQDDGVEKHLDYRDYLQVDKTEVLSLRISTPCFINTIDYGYKGSFFQHTQYSNGDEMLIIQSEIEPDITHSIKLTKSKSCSWVANNIELLLDKTAEVVSLK